MDDYEDDRVDGKHLRRLDEQGSDAGLLAGLLSLLSRLKP